MVFSDPTFRGWKHAEEGHHRRRRPSCRCHCWELVQVEASALTDLGQWVILSYFISWSPDFWVFFLIYIYIYILYMCICIYFIDQGDDPGSLAWVLESFEAPNDGNAMGKINGYIQYIYIYNGIHVAKNLTFGNLGDLPQSYGTEILGQRSFNPCQGIGVGIWLHICMT